MNFSEALIALKYGKSVRRAFWLRSHFIIQKTDDPSGIYWSSFKESYSKGHYVPTREDVNAKDWTIV